MSAQLAEPRFTFGEWQRILLEPDGSCRRYFLRVPPGIRTAREAVAWTFAVPAEEYAPAVET